MLQFHPQIKRVWVDVGSDWTTFASRDFSVWPGIKWGDGRSSAHEFAQCTDIAVIAIDPNKQYEDRLKKIPRVVPIMAAIGPQNGKVKFNHYEAEGCSSILEPGKDWETTPGLEDWYLKLKSAEEVPCFRLEEILKLIPDSLHIEFLKVDAQGIDLDVVKSAGDHLQRISKVLLEVQKSWAIGKEMYKSQNSYDEAILWLTSNGFSLNIEQSWAENLPLQEWNLVFDRIR